MAKDSKMLETMRQRLTTATVAYSESRESELDDLRFFAASPDNQWQWPQDVLNTRGAVQGESINARPCLTINKLPQHVRQVTNDQRQNRPAGKVIPVDDKADIKVAEIFDGMVRHIEYISDADVADDTACENQVTFGEGYFRILTEYCDDDSFDQDIRIKRIRNSFSVYMDPTIQDPCGADAEWCFICEDILKTEYERLYPDALPVTQLQADGVGDQSINAWLDEDTIRIAEYFYVEYSKTTLNLYADGSTMFSDDPNAKAMGEPVKTREVQRRQVKWIKTNGFEVLESRDWPGKWIPVIRIVGNEFEIDGRIYLSGLIRNAKDAQRMYNYWVSQEAEMLALQPKAPFVGYGGQFEGYEHQWKTANTQNWPYLEVNQDATDHEGRPLPLPQRAAPPMLSSGILQAKAGAADDIKGSTGQYDPSLGAESNEKSGRAILAREKQADTGTFHYVDNLGRAVRLRTRMIIDLIPKVYDTQRIARIIGVDGETDHVKLDPEQQEPVREIKDEATGAVIDRIYNPSVGKYDVCVTTGPSYMTKRQENAEVMVDLAQGASDPTVALLMRYFAVKNMDFPDAQTFANAVKKLLPPGLLDEGDESPEMAAAKQQMEQQQQVIEQMGQMLQNIQNSFEARDASREDFRAEIEQYKAETERLNDFMAAATAITPEQVQQIVFQTLQQALSQPPLEMEEPQGMEMGEMHAGAPPGMQMPPEQQPPQGGFFMPEGHEGMQP